MNLFRSKFGSAPIFIARVSEVQSKNTKHESVPAALSRRNHEDPPNWHESVEEKKCQNIATDQNWHVFSMKSKQGKISEDQQKQCKAFQCKSIASNDE